MCLHVHCSVMHFPPSSANPNLPTYTVCIKKKLVFEIQISHNYSDLIVLNCVELMMRDKKCLIYKRDQSVMSHK